MEIPTHPEDGGSSKVRGGRAGGKLGGAVAAPDLTPPPFMHTQVEVVFWLLSMLATRDKDDMSRTLLAMSSSQESCLAMRKSGCLPLLIQILHDTDREPGPPESPAGAKDARMRANAALHNIVFSQPDEGQAKKEMRVLHVLEQIRSYSETCWDWLQMQSRDGGKGPEGSAGMGLRGAGRGGCTGTSVNRRVRGTQPHVSVCAGGGGDGGVCWTPPSSPLLSPQRRCPSSPRSARPPVPS